MFRFTLTALTSLTLLVLAHSLVRADDLFRLVQPDATACVHLAGLQGNWQRLEQSEFAARLQAAPFWGDLTTGEKVANLRKVQAGLEAVLQRPLREAVESLFGQNVVLAMYASPAGPSDHVLLLEADSAESIASALTAWQALDGFQPVDRAHRGVTYRSLQKPGRPEERNPQIVQFDRVLVVAQKAERLQRLIDLRLDADAASLATHEPFAAARAARSETELAAVYINPRSLDSAVSYFLTNPEQPRFSLAPVWSRCRWLTLRLTLDTDQPGTDGTVADGGPTDELQLEVVADYDGKGAPDWWSQWLEIATTQRLPLQRIPGDAVLALSGQFSADAVQTLIRKALPTDGELPADARRVRRVGQGLLLGLDPLTELLPALGPNWLAYSVPRPPGAERDFPIDLLFAVDLRPEFAGGAAETPPEAGTVPQPSMQDALDNTLLTGLNLLAAEHNARTSGPVAVLRHKLVGDATLRWAEPVSRFRPAYAVSNNHLVVASSPELCEQFLTTAARPARSTDENGKRPTEPTQFVLARSSVARQILADHREWFLWQAHRDQVPDEVATRRLAELDAVLRLADRAELSTALNASQVRASLSLSATSAAAQSAAPE